MEKIKNFTKFFFGIPLTIVAFGFIGNFIYGSREEILSNLKHFDPLLLSAGIVAMCLFFFFRSLLWRSVLEREGYHPSVVESTYLLATSELKRYVPVGVLAIIGRVNSFQIYQIPAKTILKMIFYESVLFFTTSIIFSIPGAYFLSVEKLYDIKIILSIISVLIIAIVFVFLLTKNKIIPVIREIPRYFQPFILMSCAWIFFGIGNYLILSSFFTLNPTHIVAFSSFFVLSWLVGYIAFIFPLGLGIREGFLTYALASSIPIGTAAALSIIARVAFVITEVLFVTLAYLIYKHFKPRPKIAPSDAILFGMILSFITYFSGITIRAGLSSLLIMPLFLGSIAAIFVYRNAVNKVGDKSLALILTGSFLLNPFLLVGLESNMKLNSPGVTFFNGFVLNCIVYIFLTLIIAKLIRNKKTDKRIIATALILISIFFTYVYGVLPGSMHPYLP